MGQAASERDEVAHLTEDIERIRRRGETLTSELLHRVQPSLRRARVMMSLFQRLRETVRKIARHEVLVASALCAGAGLIAGVVIERARKKRQVRKAPGRALLQLMSGR